MDKSNLSKLARSKLSKGDIVYTYVGTIGNAAIIPQNNKFYLAPNVALIRCISVLPEYLFQILNTNKYLYKVVMPRMQTSSQPALSMDTIRKLPISYPNVNIQGNISKLLSSIDNLINNQKIQINEAKKLHKGLIEQIFRSKNQRVTTIGDAFEVITDYVAAGSFADLSANVKYLSEPTNFSLIRTTDIKNNKKSPIYIDERAYNYLYRVRLDGLKSIIMPNIGNIGEVYYIDDFKFNTPSVLGPNAILLRAHDKIISYLYFYMKSNTFKKKLFSNINSGGREKFNKTELKQIKISIHDSNQIPSITIILSQMDNFTYIHLMTCKTTNITLFSQLYLLFLHILC